MTVRPRVLLSVATMTVLMLVSFFVNTPSVAASPDLNRVIELTNQHRRAAGCGDLTWNAALANAAQGHAADMAANNYFSHTSRNGTTFGQRIRNAGYNYRLAAENIAAGHQTADAVVNGWMNSPGHRANILNCKLRQVGIGYGYNANSAYGSYWVQDFGTPR